jgi:hypothetical protein
VRPDREIDALEPIEKLTRSPVIVVQEELKMPEESEEAVAAKNAKKNG